MIKLLCFLKRRPGMPRDEFHGHWLETHGGLFANSPELRRYVLRYEQNPRLPADYDRERRPGEVADTGFDGVTVQWFESIESFQAMTADPVYEKLVAPDSDKFLDREGLKWVLTAPPDVILEKPGGRERATTKLICMITQNPKLGRDEFHKHWLEHHGGLFRNIPDLERDILAYDQNHRLAADYALDPSRTCDGVTEQWFESLEVFLGSMDVPASRTMVHDDVAYMLDSSGTHFIMSEMPNVIIAD